MNRFPVSATNRKKTRKEEYKIQSFCRNGWVSALECTSICPPVPSRCFSYCLFSYGISKKAPMDYQVSRQLFFSVYHRLKLGTALIYIQFYLTVYLTATPFVVSYRPDFKQSSIVRPRGRENCVRPP